MPINVDAAIAKYNGVWNISFDGVPANAGQCVQLVASVCRDNGLPVIWADAAYWFINFNQPGAYDKIANNPSDPNQLPQKGDVMVWNTNLPNSGGAGHIAIVVSTHPGGFVSFDSNWGGKYAHLVTHNWSYVLGWLHPKGAAPAPAPQGVEMITTPDQSTKMYKMLRPNGGGSTAEVNGWVGQSFGSFLNVAQPEIAARDAGLREQAAKLGQMSDQINQLNGVVTQVNTDSKATKDDLQKALKEVSDLTSQLTTSHDQIKELQDRPEPSEQAVVQNWLIRLWNNLFKKGQ